MFDFIAIGDTTTDAFIRLEDASVDKDKGLLCMRFADKIPYKSVTVVPAVGNSANAAVSASRLGLSSALATNIGADDEGKETLAVLENERVDTRFVTSHADMRTNYHYVLWYHDERTILVKHEEYDYRLPNLDDPKWVYLSSLGGNSLPFHAEITDFLNARPNVKFAFQPGTYQMKFGKEKLAEIYRRADLFFCNKQEAQRILETEESDIKKLLGMMRDIGPKTPVITDGRAGAYAYDGTDMWHMPMYPDPKPPVDRTGAGDAFSSAFTSAIALGLHIEDALRWGPINSMSVVQYVGAREGLLTRAELEEYLAKAPADYKPEKI
jgi:ribokinase